MSPYGEPQPQPQRYEIDADMWSAYRAENRRLRDTLERVKRNAEGWHGTNPREVNSAYGQQDALNVIAGWCREALAGDAG